MNLLDTGGPWFHWLLTVKQGRWRGSRKKALHVACAAEFYTGKPCTNTAGKGQLHKQWLWSRCLFFIIPTRTRLKFPLCLFINCRTLYKSFTFTITFFSSEKSRLIISCLHTPQRFCTIYMISPPSLQGRIFLMCSDINA